MRIMALALMGAMAAALCFPAGADHDTTGSENNNESEVLEVTTFTAESKNVRPLGRTAYVNDCLIMSFSGSGAEFAFRGKSASVTMLCDDNYKSNKDNCPRVAVFVNEERVLDVCLSQQEETFAIISSDEERECTVRILKLSETGNSSAAIKSITTEAGGTIRPTEAPELSIEFIGDSITCGYGVDAPDQNHPFSVATEDCSKAYAYQTAKLLNADYSLVSKSGHGIITGYTTEGVIADWGILPRSYPLTGDCAVNIAGVMPNSLRWDFESNPRDIVVINLGTNDASYTGKDPGRRDEYRKAYVEFLGTVREKNPDAHIICALGIMGDDLYEMAAAAVEDFCKATGDEKVTAFRFEPQKSANGYGADWHPSAKTHALAAEAMAEYIKELVK